MENDEQKPKMGFGFKLGKSSAVKKLQPGVLSEQEQTSRTTEFITGVEGKEIQGDGTNEG